MQRSGGYYIYQFVAKWIVALERWASAMETHYSDLFTQVGPIFGQDPNMLCKVVFPRAGFSVPKLQEWASVCKIYPFLSSLFGNLNMVEGM